MPVLKNPRHERFAQLLATGKTKTAAYVEAGYSHNDGNSSVLARSKGIANRVKELLEKQRSAVDIAAQRAAVTVETLLAEAEQCRAMAVESGQIAAAIAAIREKGVLSGKRVERSERGQPGEFEAIENMTAEELQNYLASPDLDDEHEGSVH